MVMVRMMRGAPGEEGQHGHPCDARNVTSLYRGEHTNPHGDKTVQNLTHTEEHQ